MESNIGVPPCVAGIGVPRVLTTRDVEYIKMHRELTNMSSDELSMRVKGKMTAMLSPVECYKASSLTPSQPPSRFDLTPLMVASPTMANMVSELSRSTAFSESKQRAETASTVGVATLKCSLCAVSLIHVYNCVGPSGRHGAVSSDEQGSVRTHYFCEGCRENCIRDTNCCPFCNRHVPRDRNLAIEILLVPNVE